MKRTNLIAQSVGLVLLLRSAVLGWDPPIGIPRPSFGIEETYRMYDDPANRNPELTYTQNEEGGYYTHYIDNTRPDATDDSNPYGTENKPRLTLPDPIGVYPNNSGKWLKPGSVVDVHGGPYAYPPELFPTIYSGISVYSDASVDKPAFIRGAGAEKPVLGDFIFYIAGQYLIIENFEFQKTSVSLQYAWNVPILGADYVSVRNNEFVGHNEVGWRGGTGTYGGADDTVSNIVFYNNHIHHYGKWDNTVPVGDKNDAMGIGIGVYSERVWIVDNHIHHNGGDSIHIGNSAKRTARYIYIGRNDMHDDRENAVDVKEGMDVIISQNTMHNYLELGRDDDGTIAHTHQGSMADNTCPKNIWWIFNKMYNASNAAHTGISGDDIYFIGNVVYNTSSAFGSYQFTSNEKHYYVGNTMYGLMNGIVTTVESPDVSLSIADNIFYLFKGTGMQRAIGIDINPNNTTLDNNLFYQQDGEALIMWGRDSGGYYAYYTLEEIQSSIGKGLNCIEADPLFVDSVNNDLHLQPTSPAIDAGTSSGVVQEVFDRFEQLYGIDIRKDIEGGVRPYGAEWDMGAYEWGSTPADPDSETEPDIDTEPAAEPDSFIPDVTALLVMNNIIKSGGNQSALIRCDMKDAGKLTIKIYDAKGKEIVTLCNEQREAGRHEFIWAGQDSAGSSVGSGIYMVHCKVGGYTETKKIAIVK